MNNNTQTLKPRQIESTNSERRIAIVGDAGVAFADDYEIAIAGARSIATVGVNGFARAGALGIARAAAGGVVMAGYDGVLVLEYWNNGALEIMTGKIGKGGLKADTPYRNLGGQFNVGSNAAHAMYKARTELEGLAE